MIKTSWLSVAGKLGLNVDLVFRSDDADHTVLAGLFSAIPQCVFEFLLSENRDFVLTLGYRLGGPSSHWTYSQQDDEGNPETVGGEWIGPAPEVDASGLFITAGIKFISF